MISYVYTKLHYHIILAKCIFSETRGTEKKMPTIKLKKGKILNMISGKTVGDVYED
jgi:hypothetical protein